MNIGDLWTADQADYVLSVTCQSCTDTRKTFFFQIGLPITLFLHARTSHLKHVARYATPKSKMTTLIYL